MAIYERKCDFHSISKQLPAKNIVSPILLHLNIIRIWKEIYYCKKNGENLFEMSKFQ